jgi:type IV secretory pathway component VirB8
MRFILYFICGILVILGIIGFIALIALTILTPLAYQTCSYLDVQLSTQTGTLNLFTNLGMEDIGNKLSVCMGGN